MGSILKTSIPTRKVHFPGRDVSIPFSLSRSSSIPSGSSTSKSSTAMAMGRPSLPEMIIWIESIDQKIRFRISISRTLLLGFVGAHLLEDLCNPSSIAKLNVVVVIIQQAPGLGKLRRCRDIIVKACTSCIVWLAIN